MLSGYLCHVKLEGVFVFNVPLIYPKLKAILNQPFTYLEVQVEHTISLIKTFNYSIECSSPIILNIPAYIMIGKYKIEYPPGKNICHRLLLAC